MSDNSGDNNNRNERDPREIFDAEGNIDQELAERDRKILWAEEESNGSNGLVDLSDEAQDAESERWNQASNRQHRREAREQWVQSPQGRLCMEMYRNFREYEKYLKKHKQAWYTNQGEVDWPEHKLFLEGLRQAQEHQEEREERDRRNLEKAQQAARCEHKFLSGEQCKAPRMRDGKLCRMHQAAEEAKALKLDLGHMEDPDSMQVAIKRLQRAVIDESLSHQQIRELTNLLQIATWNVTRTRFAREQGGTVVRGELEA